MSKLIYQVFFVVGEEIVPFPSGSYANLPYISATTYTNISATTHTNYHNK